MHCTYRALLSGVFASPLSRASTLPPSFLLPFGASQTSTFSTSILRSARKCGNPAKGVSALRRTGLKRQKLATKVEDLPQPKLDPATRSSVEVDPDHGLWEFFYEQDGNRTALPIPAQLDGHGRGWTVPELRQKSWEDLHKLWWVCMKEMNRLRTFDSEKDRIGHLFGEYESEKRKEAIKKTQRSIKAALTERWYTWQNARSLAMEDPEINMYADIDQGEAAYIPRDTAFERDPKADASLAPPNSSPTNEVRA